MDQRSEVPGCRHHVHQRAERGAATPTHLCSCPAGTIHMHDCPVLLGLACVHFQPTDGAPAAVERVEFERLHDRLMGDYLTRPYLHRVRSLAPQPEAWQSLRDRLSDAYARASPDGEPPEEEAGDDERYEREKARLLEVRRRLEAAAAESAPRMDAAELARRGIKTVVQRAQETIAAQGNVASSFLDEKPPQ
ncbi:MAG: hypothetical protein ACREID_03270, partial [Planctomycetota bacterium]